MADSRHLSTMKDEQQVRQRAGIYFGTIDEYGAAGGLKELIDNGADEAKEGFADHILVKFFDDGSVLVEDNGRGLPMGWNEGEQKYNWEIALCTLYGSGKYDDKQYSDSTGLNGLGLTATQYSSEYMDVWSTYDGKTRYMHFEKGKPIGEMVESEPIVEGTGTRIKYKPDPEVFPALREKSLPLDYFLSLVRQQAMLVEGLTIELDHYTLEKPLVIQYKNGIADFISSLTANTKSMLSETKYFFREVSGTDDEISNPIPYKLKMRMAFNFSDEVHMTELYHNGSEMIENPGIKGDFTYKRYKKAIEDAFTAFGISKGSIQKGESFTYKDVEPLMLCVSQTSCPGNRTKFAHQTKVAVENKFILKAYYNFTYESIISWFKDGGTEVDKVLEKVVLNKQIREESDKVSTKILRKLKSPVSLGNKPENFYDCESKDKNLTEIYIVEGRSAASSILASRFGMYQALFGLRGKPINALKHSITAVLANDIVTDIFKILGCGMELHGDNFDKIPKFDASKLRYNKIIICTDADVDGYHIRCLVILIFYILCPSLLKMGKVYIAETPLYELNYRDDIQFAYDEDEKEQVLQGFEAKGISRDRVKIQRSKGLGENNADMMTLTTMAPDTRRLIKINYPEDDVYLRQLFVSLLGDNIAERKLLLEEYFDKTEIVS